MKAFHECELKLKIDDSEMENKIVSKHRNGLYYGDGKKGF